jgi:hypothetical protein
MNEFYAAWGDVMAICGGQIIGYAIGFLILHLTVWWND